MGEVGKGIFSERFLPSKSDSCAEIQQSMQCLEILYILAHLHRVGIHPLAIPEQQKRETFTRQILSPFFTVKIEVSRSQ